MRRRPRLRLCSAWDACGTVRVFCCGSFVRMYKGCTAANLFYAAPFFAVAAQCADAIRGRHAVRSTFYAISQRCRFAKGRVQKSGNMARLLSLPLRGALGCCKGVVRCKKAKCSSLFDRTEDFPPRTHRAHCAATAKREAQQSNLVAVHPLYTQAIDAQQKHKLRTAHLPRPAPARSAVKRTASVTTGHHLYNVLTTCAAKERDGYPQVCTQRPSFSSPPCTALFFFSAHGEKEEGGASPTNEMWMHSQHKNGIPKREGTPSPKGRLCQNAASANAPAAPRAGPCPKGQTPLRPGSDPP